MSVIIKARQLPRQADDPEVRNRWKVSIIAPDGSVAARNIPLYGPGKFNAMTFIACLLTDADISGGSIVEVMREWDMTREQALKARRAAERAIKAIDAAFTSLRGSAYERLISVPPDVRERYLSMAVRYG